MLNSYYYKQALQKNRLFPFTFENRLVGFITFYFSSSTENIRDSWDVSDDESCGEICIIQQLLTDKEKLNPKLSYSIWSGFKDYIREIYPQIKYIYWRRWKDNKLKIYIKKMMEEINAKV